MKTSPSLHFKGNNHGRILLVLAFILATHTVLFCQQKALIQIGAGASFGSHLQSILNIDKESPFLGPSFQFAYITNEDFIGILEYGIEGVTLGGGYVFSAGEKVQYPITFGFWGRSFKTSDTEEDAGTSGLKLSLGRSQYLSNRLLYTVSAFTGIGGISIDDTIDDSKSGFAFTPGLSIRMNFQIKINR